MSAGLIIAVTILKYLDFHLIPFYIVPLLPFSGGGRLRGVDAGSVLSQGARTLGSHAGL